MPYPRFYKLDKEKQQRIIQTAVDEFAEFGFQQASLNSIIEKSGLSAGSLYYYFENKEDLLSLVLEETIGQVKKQFLTLETVKEGNFWETIERGIHWRIQFTIDNPKMVAILNHILEWPFNKLDQFPARDFIQHLFDFFKKMISLGQQLGEIRTDVPFELLVQLQISFIITINKWVQQHWQSIMEHPSHQLHDPPVATVLGMLRHMFAPDSKIQVCSNLEQEPLPYGSKKEEA